MRSRFKSGFSLSDRTFINQVHKLVFGKRVVNTSCSDCWRDAYILTYNKLKKMGQLPKEKDYIIRNGCIMSIFGTNITRTGANATTEEAEQYLKRFPQQIKIFSRYPSDWKERIANVEIKTYEPVAIPPVALSEEENKDLRIITLEKQLADANKQIEELKQQLEVSSASETKTKKRTRK